MKPIKTTLHIIFAIALVGLNSCDSFLNNNNETYPSLIRNRIIQNESDQDLLLRFVDVSPREIYKLIYDTLYRDDQLGEIVEIKISANSDRTIYSFSEIGFASSVNSCIIEAEQTEIKGKFASVNKSITEEGNWEKSIDKEYNDGGGIVNCYFKIDNKHIDERVFHHIVAGDRSDSYYYEVWDTLSASGGIDIPNNGERLNIDIDLDGYSDIQFEAYGGGGQGYYIHGSEVITSPNCNILIDTFYSTDGRIMLAPEKTPLNDTIDNRLVFTTDAEVYVLSYLSFSMMGPPTSLEAWNNVYDNYLGLQLISNRDTLYSWIRIDVTNYSTIVVKDYAIRK